MPFPILKFDTSLDLIGTELRLGHHHTVCQLLCRHLKREDGYRHIEIHSSIAGHIDHEGSLSHGRACRKDDKVGSLPAKSYLVDRREAGRDSAQTIRILSLLQILQCIVDDFSNFLHILLDIVLDGSEKFGLGCIYQIIDIYRLII